MRAIYYIKGYRTSRYDQHRKGRPRPHNSTLTHKWPWRCWLA